VTKPLLVTLAALCACSMARDADVTYDPPGREYLFGRSLALPPTPREKVFTPDEGRANFTFFSGAADLTVQGGRLRFSLADGTAILGWGNYLGRRAPTQVQDMWQQTQTVALLTQQSAAETQWSVRLWRDGKDAGVGASVKAEGDQEQEVRFKDLHCRGATPDGFELRIEGSKGEQVEIAWVKLIQPLHAGYCRAEFTLPEGRIWRAVANVGSANYRNWFSTDEMHSRLHINGREVPRRGALYLYHTEAVDISPYLKPGRNCVGLYGSRIFYGPFIYFQARVIMDSGEVISVATDRTWKTHPKAAEGWDDVGYDDSGWSPPTLGSAPALSARDCAGQLGIPAYSGPVVLRNPTRRDLFYPADAPVRVDVHVPPGLITKDPVVFYELGLADEEGNCAAVTEGTVKPPARGGGALIFPLELGTLPGGVYALAASLKDGEGRPIEARVREPLVVLEPQKQPVVRGHEYTEGMDLELEDVVDFTDPADPHPSFEAASPAHMTQGVAAPVDQPTLVSGNGLSYREVSDPKRGSGFSYRIQFEHPGDFYYFELEYPDDAKRVIEVIIASKQENVWSNCQSGVGAETGGRFLLTDEMRTLRWLHVADPGPHSVDIVNAVEGWKAAAGRLRVYHVKGDLPRVEAGASRLYGIHTERCFPTSGLGVNFGTGEPEPPQRKKNRSAEDTPTKHILRDLVWMKRTCERYAQYLQFCGQNCHVMGCYQYNDYNTPFIKASPLADDARVPSCMKTMLANVLQVNDIGFYAGLEFSQSLDVQTYANNAQVARGADTVYMVNKRGEQRYCHRRGTMVPNWLEPRIKAACLATIRDIRDTFGHLSCFRGIFGPMGPSIRRGYWIPGYGSGEGHDDPLDASYDDHTMELLSRETTIALPIDPTAPSRFAQRAALLRLPGLRPSFTQWRAAKVTDFFGQAARTLRKYREDLELVNVAAVEDSEFLRHLYESDETFAASMRQFAIDIPRLQSVAGLCLARETISWRQAGDPFPSQDPYCWLPRTRPEFITPFAHPTKRSVFVRSSWDENLLWAPGQSLKEKDSINHLLDSDWIMRVSRIRALPQPGSYNSREAFVLALITDDPSLLVGGFTDLTINVGHEQLLRRVLSLYTRLPKAKFSPALDTGPFTDIAIRKLEGEDRSWFYIANPCPWPVKGTVTLRANGTLTDLATGSQAMAREDAADGVLPVSLEPFGLMAYTVAANRVDLKSYTIEPLQGEHRNRLEAIPDRVAELLADPTARLSLSPQDRHDLAALVVDARACIQERRYAEAWRVISQPDFWALWQDYLEPAAVE